MVATASEAFGSTVLPDNADCLTGSLSGKRTSNRKVRHSGRPALVTLAVPDLGRSSELTACKKAHPSRIVDRQSASNFMSMRPVSISAPSKNQVIVVVTVMTGHNGHNLNREISWLVI